MPSGVYERTEKHKHTEEWKKKMSKFMRGNQNAKGTKHSKETRLKMSKAMKGKKLSDEHRMKISEAMRGRKLTDKHKNKISVGLSIAFGGNGNTFGSETYHVRAWVKHFQNMEVVWCEKCGLVTNSEHKERTGERLSLHNDNPNGDYSDMSVEYWHPMCRVCHQEEHRELDRKQS